MAARTCACSATPAHEAVDDVAAGLAVGGVPRRSCGLARRRDRRRAWRRASYPRRAAAMILSAANGWSAGLTSTASGLHSGRRERCGASRSRLENRERRPDRSVLPGHAEDRIAAAEPRGTGPRCRDGRRVPPKACARVTPIPAVRLSGRFSRAFTDSRSSPASPAPASGPDPRLRRDAVDQQRPTGTGNGEPSRPKPRGATASALQPVRRSGADPLRGSALLAEGRAGPPAAALRGREVTVAAVVLNVLDRYLERHLRYRQGA